MAVRRRGGQHGGRRRDARDAEHRRGGPPPRAVAVGLLAGPRQRGARPHSPGLRPPRPARPARWSRPSARWPTSRAPRPRSTSPASGRRRSSTSTRSPGPPASSARLDGYLSGPRSPGSARAAALGFVRVPPRRASASPPRTCSTLGLPQGLRRLPRRSTTCPGSSTSTARPSSATACRSTSPATAGCSPVQGSPVSGPRAAWRGRPRRSTSTPRRPARRPPATCTARWQSNGVATARRGAGASTHWSNHDYAERVWFLSAGGLRPGWSTYVQTGDDSAYQHVIDAATGKALYRHSTVDSASGDAYVYDYYPGARPARRCTARATGTGPTRGRPRSSTSTRWGGSTGAARPSTARNVITWADVNDDDSVEPRRADRGPGAQARRHRQAEDLHRHPEGCLPARRHVRRRPLQRLRLLQVLHGALRVHVGRREGLVVEEEPGRRTRTTRSTWPTPTTTTCRRTPRSGSPRRRATSRPPAATRSCSRCSTARTSTAACPTPATSTTRT